MDLPQGPFTTQLVTTRSTFTFSPTMFVSALVQYTSSNNAVSSNVRFRWEYQPGSELFVVYNEQRDTLVPKRISGLENRAFIIKFTRLVGLRNGSQASSPPTRLSLAGVITHGRAIPWTLLSPSSRIEPWQSNGAIRTGPGFPVSRPVLFSAAHRHRRRSGHTANRPAPGEHPGCAV